MSAAEQSDASAGSVAPDAAGVRAQLERILASRSFDQAGRASDFLRFVVEQTLAGNAQRLKGYTIAVDVFGRPETFDAQNDPLVRVEAGRLRRRLAEYYADEGARDPIRIELPRGGYSAVFRCTAVHEPRPIGAAPRRRRNRVARRIFAAAALVAAGAAVVHFARDETHDVLALPEGPRILVLPFENLSGDPQLEYFADGITEEIMLRLGNFELFVIASDTSWQFRGQHGTPERAGTAVDAGYVLTGSVRSTPERIRIGARLVNGTTGAQLWSAAYDETPSVDSLLAVEERIAQEVAATIAVPYGPLFDAELARTEHKPAANLATYDCVLKYYYYRRTLDPALHRDAVECFQRAVVEEPAFANAWAGLALLYLDEHSFGYNRQSDGVDALERAREAARTALDISGDNFLANLALVRLRFFDGDRAGFARSANRVLELNPNSAEALALIGTLRTISEDTDDALPLVEKAIALSPRPPGLYYIARTAVDMRAGNHEEALAWALRLDSPNWFIAPMLAAAAAARANRPDVAARNVERLLDLYPRFAELGSTELAKWRLEPTLYEALIDGLSAAGLELEASP